MHARSRNRGSWFTRFAKSTARASGHPAIFCGAVAVIVLWAASGPLFGFSDTWQLVINTGTTIITLKSSTTRISTGSAPAIASWRGRHGKICAKEKPTPMSAKSVLRIASSRARSDATTNPDRAR